MKYILLISVLLSLGGCCNTAGFMDSNLCHFLKGEPMKPGGGSGYERIRIRDLDTGKTRTYEIKRY